MNVYTNNAIWVVAASLDDALQLAGESDRAGWREMHFTEMIHIRGIRGSREEIQSAYYWIHKHGRGVLCSI